MKISTHDLRRSLDGEMRKNLENRTVSKNVLCFFLKRAEFRVTETIFVHTLSVEIGCPQKSAARNDRPSSPPHLKRHLFRT